MHNLKEALAESYCTAIRDRFENVTSAGTDARSVDKQEIELYRQLEQYQKDTEKVMEEWANTPVESLGSLTPSEIINAMEEFDEVFDLFLYMAEHTDEEIPFIVTEKLKSFSGRAVSTLADLAGTRFDDPNTDMVFIAAVSALGRLGVAESVRPLIDLAYKMNEKGYELDHIEEALKNAGSCTIEPILGILEEKEMGSVEKMLLYVLASVGSNFRDDRIYTRLRTAFRTMEDKMPAVICLKAYGDGRAVPMLRGYLERNGDLDRALYYEIVGTIRSLGGRTEDFLRAF